MFPGDYNILFGYNTLSGRYVLQLDCARFESRAAQCETLPTASSRSSRVRCPVVYHLTILFITLL